MNDQPPPAKSPATFWKYAALFVLLMVGIPAAIIGGISVLGHRAEVTEERLASELCQREFDKVKQGATSATVFDERLLARLAADAECAARLQKLEFAMVDVSPAAAQHVAQFPNLNGIYFYDTRGAEHVLKHARGLGVEEIGFSAVQLTRDHFRYLAEFPELKRLSFAEELTEEQRAMLVGLGEVVRIEVPGSGGG